VLTNLGAALLDGYDRTGERRDLEEAIGALVESVAATGLRSPELPARLNNLANGLRRRFERDGDAADAREAAAAYRAGQRLDLEVATEAAMGSGAELGRLGAPAAGLGADTRGLRHGALGGRPPTPTAPRTP
jgi:hypothetical protein